MSSYHPLPDDELVSTDKMKRMILALQMEKESYIFDLEKQWYNYEKNIRTNDTLDPLTVYETDEIPPFDLSSYPIDLILGMRVIGEYEFTIRWRDILLGRCATTKDKPIARFNRIIPYMILRLYGSIRIECLATDMPKFRLVCATIDPQERNQLMKKMVRSAQRQA